MANSDRTLEQILKALKDLNGTVEIMQQDINAIRNGQYDKPQGATAKVRPASPVSDSDLGVTSRDW